LSSCYAQLTLSHKFAQHAFIQKNSSKEGSETLLAHIAELQRLREACGGLGLDITDAQFLGIILSMKLPSWNPMIRHPRRSPRQILLYHISTLNGAEDKDPLHLEKIEHSVSQSIKPRCENCSRQDHIMEKCGKNGW